MRVASLRDLILSLRDCCNEPESRSSWPRIKLIPRSKSILQTIYTNSASATCFRSPPSTAGDLMNSWTQSLQPWESKPPHPKLELQRYPIGPDGKGHELSRQSRKRVPATKFQRSTTTNQRPRSKLPSLDTPTSASPHC